MTVARLARLVARGISAGARGLLPYTLLAAACFLALAVIGGAVGVGNGSATVLPMRATDGEIVERSMAYFLHHNVPIALKAMAGAVTLGLYSLYVVGLNGFLLGAVFVEAVGIHGLVVALALLMPHGIFELPAIWLAGAVSFRWVHAVWRVSRGTRTGGGIDSLFLQTAVGAGVSLLLLVVAAFVESSLTVPIARLVGG